MTACRFLLCAVVSLLFSAHAAASMPSTSLTGLIVCTHLLSGAEASSEEEMSKTIVIAFVSLTGVIVILALIENGCRYRRAYNNFQGGPLIFSPEKKEKEPMIPDDLDDSPSKCTSQKEEVDYAPNIHFEEVEHIEEVEGGSPVVILHEEVEGSEESAGPRPKAEDVHLEAAGEHQGAHFGHATLERPNLKKAEVGGALAGKVGGTEENPTGEPTLAV